VRFRVHRRPFLEVQDGDRLISFGFAENFLECGQAATIHCVKMLAHFKVAAARGAQFFNEDVILIDDVGPGFGDDVKMVAASR